MGTSIADAGPFVALAIIIWIQNAPEGIAAYKYMMAGKTAFNNNPKKALAAIGIVYIISHILGLIGLFYLQGMEYFISTILVLSSGGTF